MAETEPQPLARELDQFITDCTECGSCVKQCAFLQRHGTPAALAKQHRAGELPLETIYSCNLCRLCDVYCPEKIEPSRIFLDMRRSAVAAGSAPLKQHRMILAYEKWGTSGLLRLTAIPEQASAVFFPGCALAGSRPAQLLTLFEMLGQQYGDLGMVLNCCCKPSHDLGRDAYFKHHFGGICESLTARGVDTVITACPSCHQVFEQYGAGFKVRTVYDVLAENDDLARRPIALKARIHDPCATRFAPGVHAGVRKLADKIGIETEEMKHRGKRTLCCGEGAAACFVAPDITAVWAEKRAEEADGAAVLTYCAGCVQFLSERFTAIHIIDLLVEPRKTLDGALKIARSPMTYVNRFILKWKLKWKLRG